MKDFLCLERPFLDLVSQTPCPRGGGRPLFAEGWRFIHFLRGDAGGDSSAEARWESSIGWQFPNLVVLNLVVCNVYAYLRSFALICADLLSFADLRLRSFARNCALLHTFLRPTAFRTTAFGNYSLGEEQSRN